MGVGPVPASRKALARAGIEVGDLDLVELNEAFAVAVARVHRRARARPREGQRQRRRDRARPPAWCIGRAPVTILVHELRRRGGRYGLATMCIGVGQGIATVVERVEEQPASG